MSMEGYGTKGWRRNIAEAFNWLTRVHERYKQTNRQTDIRQTNERQHSERERERTFTFANHTEANITSCQFDNLFCQK